MISSEREYGEKNSREMKVEEKDRKKWSKMLEQDEESLGERRGIILMLTGAMCLYVSEKSCGERQQLPPISVLSASECCRGVC